MIISKTIIICDDNKKAVGILKLEQRNDSIEYEIKMSSGKPPYNFALCVNNDFFFITCPSQLKTGELKSSIDSKTIELVGGGTTSLWLKGSNRGSTFFNSKLIEYYYSNINNTSKEEKSINSILDKTVQEEVSSTNLNDNITNTEAKIIGVDNLSEEVDKEINAECPFFKKIEKQLSSLFETYPKEEYLSKAIENSKWVKVPVDDEAYYVVGLISDNDTPLYICYGVPDADNKNPPKEKCESQWIPIESTIDEIGGYWVMFQSAKDGKS